MQEVLLSEGALLTALRGFADGSLALTRCAVKYVEVALPAVQLLGDKPPPARVDAGLTRELVVTMLRAAGQARLLPASRSNTGSIRHGPVLS